MTEDLKPRFVRRFGDWKLKVWTGTSWSFRRQRVRYCWPYGYSLLWIGPVQIVLTYAPACARCLNDEHVLFPGKLCQSCYETVRYVRIVHVYGSDAVVDDEPTPRAFKR